MTLRKHVNIFCDGSSLGNPGPSGYGAILEYKGHRKELFEGYKLSTNNRMEMLAAVKALSLLKGPCDVTLTTDSQYLRQGITSWVKNWKKNSWKTASKQPVKNVDLWKQLDALSEQHNISWKWVKGHSGHPENERCDELARKAAGANPTQVDSGYQAS